jgi:quercetin dioxygenase-like cupin family protein
MTQTSSAARRAMAVSSGEGEARWWFGQLAEIKATAADTAGQLTIVEVTCPPGLEAPLHVHHREDEAFWILDGEVTLHVGDETIEAGPGDYAFGPRDVPHRYTVGDSGCHMLFICTPGGFENLVRNMSEPAASRSVPPPSEPPDIEWVQAIAEKHGCELLPDATPEHHR